MNHPIAAPVHPAVSAADELATLRRRLELAEAVVAAARTYAPDRCNSGTCTTDICTAFRAYDAFAKEHAV